MISHLRKIALITCLSIVITSKVHAQPKDDVLSVLRDWERLRSRCKTITYSIEGTMEIGKDAKTDPNDPDLPPGSNVRQKQLHALFDFANARLKTNFFSEFPYQGKEYQSRSNQNAFNGKTHQTLIPRDKNPNRSATDPDLVISNGEQSQDQIEVSYFPLFMAHGYVPNIYQNVTPDFLKTKLNPEMYFVQGRGTINGKPCLILRTETKGGFGEPSFDEFWIDESRQSIILRAVLYTGNAPWFRWDIEYQNSPIGWIPQSWVYTWTLGGKIKQLDRLKVRQYEIDPPVKDQDFEFEIKPGMIVQDFTTPKADGQFNPVYPATQKYRIDETGNKQILEEKGFTAKDGKELPIENGNSRFGIIAIMIAITLAACGFYIRRRYWSRHVESK